jgi:hypothetical protein
MGDVWIPDRSITVDELLKLQEVWEEDWNSPSGTDRWKLQVALIAMAVTSGFSGALRCEEIPKANLGKIYRKDSRHTCEKVYSTLRNPI